MISQQMCGCPYCETDRAVGVAHEICPYKVELWTAERDGKWWARVDLGDGKVGLENGPHATQQDAIAACQKFADIAARGLGLGLGGGVGHMSRNRSWWVRMLERAKGKTCWVYCPGCDVDLTESSATSREDDAGLVHYDCECGVHSKWDFDLPVPVLVEIDRSCTAVPQADCT